VLNKSQRWWCRSSRRKSRCLYVRWKKYSHLDGSMRCNICKCIYLGKLRLEDLCKEIMNFSSMYFSCANNVNAHMTRYHIVEEVMLTELKIFQWKGKCVGATSAHFLMDEGSGTIPCFTCIRIWRKFNHILTRLTRHIRNLVNILQWSNWITSTHMRSKVAQASRSGSTPEWMISVWWR
jgi:hypothetical protein